LYVPHVRGKTALTRARVTVGYCICNDAGLLAELPVLLICRGKCNTLAGKPRWAGVDVPKRMSVSFNLNAYMDARGAKGLIEKLVTFREAHCPGRQVILVWDAFSAHLTEDVKNFCKLAGIVMLVIPAGMTRLLQGLDTHCNRIFKAACKRFFAQRMYAADSPDDFAMSAQELLDMVEGGVSQAHTRTVEDGSLAGEPWASACFKTLGLVNAIDGSEDHFISIKHPSVSWSERRAVPPQAPEAFALGGEDPGCDDEELGVPSTVEEMGAGPDAPPSANDVVDVAADPAVFEDPKLPLVRAPHLVVGVQRITLWRDRAHSVALLDDWVVTYSEEVECADGAFRTRVRYPCGRSGPDEAERLARRHAAPSEVPAPRVPGVPCARVAPGVVDGDASAFGVALYLLLFCKGQNELETC